MTHYGVIEVRFSVSGEETQWLRYDAVEPDSECRGVTFDDDWYDTCLAYAEHELEYYLPHIIEDQYLKHILWEGGIDVRVRVFEGTGWEGPPAALLEATREQMAPLLLQASCRATRKTRSDLRERAALAAKAGMPLASLIEQVRDELDEQALASLLDAHRTADRVRATITALDMALAERTTVTVDDGDRVRLCLDFTHDEEINFKDLAHDDGRTPLSAYDCFHEDGLKAAGRLLDVLTTDHDVLTDAGTPATPPDMAPQSFRYKPVTIRSRPRR